MFVITCIKYRIRCTCSSVRVVAACAGAGAGAGAGVCCGYNILYGGCSRIGDNICLVGASVFPRGQAIARYTRVENEERRHSIQQ